MMNSYSKTDVVIPLNNSSKVNNLELMYALRSLEYHMIDLGDIYIVGNKPSWVKNVIHVPFNDIYENNKNQNILQKILHTINEEKSLSNDFLFTNDDIFMLHNFYADTLPNYYENSLSGYLKSKPLLNSKYKNAVLNTLQILEDKNSPTLHFDIHCPIIYNKKRFKEICSNVKQEVVIKSLYANQVFSISQEMKDIKIHNPINYQQIVDTTFNKFCFSLSDNCINEDMCVFLFNTFPIPSKYEKRT